MAEAPKPAALAGLPILDRIDPRVIQDLALSDEDEVQVFQRYGFTEDEARRLAADPIIKTEVQTLVTELRRAGTTAKVKARLAAESLIGDIYRKAKAATVLGDMLDAFKALAKVGDLEPRNDGNGKLTGTIVRVDLNIGQLGFAPAVSAQGGAVIGATSITQVDVTDVSHIDGSIAAVFLGMELDALHWEEACL